MNAVSSEPWELEDFIRDRLDDWIELFEWSWSECQYWLRQAQNFRSGSSIVQVDSEANSDIASSKDKRVSRLIEWE
ncbi:hypothetical protein K435DRAFT_880389 [Dendrothele bispora CBS 962.96]|uniref:Uncharacterized protein n=1 Tax=Dendrothele bispora (strain CBS 962.96) TaxID=1314807 RepID=A0A4S8KJR6_DENBC|nr:hypothetical protein K435DRAFT_880389 [Dendrothele bispora CBS 962.96]